MRDITSRSRAYSSPRVLVSLSRDYSSTHGVVIYENRVFTAATTRGARGREGRERAKETGDGINLGLILIKPPATLICFSLRQDFYLRRAYIYMRVCVCACIHTMRNFPRYATALSMLRVTFTRGKSAHGCGAIQYIFFIHFTLVITK